MTDPASLLPHAGASVMLDELVAWDADRVLCRTRRHLDPANPLRRDGRLPALAGIEFGLQAAALHGGLTAGAAQRPGYAASLREVTFAVDRLDDPAIPAILVEAVCHARDRSGLSYAFSLTAEAGGPLLAGRATIALPP